MAHRLLLIDDDEAVLEVFQTLLENRNYVVDCARNLKETEEQFGHNLYSLVITDLSLGNGESEGLEVLQFVACQALKPRIVVCSGYTTNDTREQVLQSGADLFVAKPFAFKQFFEALDALLRTAAPLPPVQTASSRLAPQWSHTAG